MQIAGVGVDSESISRFKKLGPAKAEFLVRIYTPKEIAYCFKKPAPAEHLAARFAAKEAVIKSFGGMKTGLDYPEIEIVTNRRGAPQVKVAKRLRSKILLSLTHHKKYATAFVIRLTV